MFKRLILSLAIFSSGFLNAQEIRQAGWQQKVDYTISVRLDDEKHILHGVEKMVYHNQSPNALTEIYIHLWPNAYLDNNTPFAKQQVENGKTEFYFSDERSKGRMDSLSFKINGERIKAEFLNNGFEICRLILPRPLASNGQLEITTTFRVKLPDVFSRLGHEGQMYCITQWYPKPAVYDVNGWNMMSYLDQGEFYSEFGRFDVSITVPDNYVVAATGDLQNADEIKHLMEISAKKFSEKQPCNKSAVPPSSSKTKTLRYIQDNVHDFAWFADKRFQVEHSEIVLANGHKVSTFLYEVCPKRSAVHMVDSAVLFYSNHVGNYPYNHASVVVTPLKAGGGMEYPTITNVTEAERQVIVHEVGHNWFYGILGTNEREYPWMDESINNYYEARSTYTRKVVQNNGLSLNGLLSGQLNLMFNSAFGLLDIQYLFSARNNTDQKPFESSEHFTGINYGTVIYSKASLAFLQLQVYLGDEVFDGMMKSYYEKWKFKHPLPGDFTDHVKTYTGKDLTWFFDDLMNGTKKPDYAICSVRSKGDSLEVKIRNRGKVRGPVDVQTIRDNEVLATRSVEPFSGKISLMLPSKDAKEVRVDAYNEAIDAYRSNNYARTKGLFKTARPVEFAMFFNLEKPQKKQVFYSPLIGVNQHNKTMLGMAFYNSLIPRKKFEYVIAPLYAFGTKDLNGYVSFQRRYLPAGQIFREIQVGLDVARFATYGANASEAFDSSGVPYENIVYGTRVYEKIAPRLTFILKEANPRTDGEKRINLRYIMTNEQEHTTMLFKDFDKHYSYVDVSYSYRKSSPLQPHTFILNYQFASAESEFQKISAEYSTFFSYGERKKGMNVRVFAAGFIAKPKEGSDERAYLRLAENNGYYDYLYDHSQFGRGDNYIGTSDLFTQQIMPGTSGFRTYASGIGQGDSWLASVNFTSTIPGILPIKPFVDIGLVNDKTILIDGNAGTTSISYEANVYYVTGVSVWLLKDIFQVNFPLFADDKTDNAWSRSFGQRMTFTLRLNDLNPIRIAREFKFN